MAIEPGNTLYSFKLFGYSFLIFKKGKIKAKQHMGGGMIVNGSCKLVRHNNSIVLATPDGTPLPHQIDLKVNCDLHEAATATVTLFVGIDE